MQRGEVYGWLHSLLNVNPLEYRFVVRAMIPRKREGSWKWELVEVRSTKHWKQFVTMGLQRHFAHLLLVQCNPTTTRLEEEVDDNVPMCLCGFIAPMCLCGTPCRLVKSLVLGDDYGKRLWMCKNYQYDPSQRLYSSDRRQRSPPPLCEFIEYVDTEQTPENIAHVYRVAQRARRH
ncbi:hypothetical protein EJB05_54232, partial [Eragrostis curvula]